MHLLQQQGYKVLNYEKPEKSQVKLYHKQEKKSSS